MAGERFARLVFKAAGLYGLAMLLPHYGMEGRIGRDFPPVLTHPEYFYGFVGVGLAWQVAFLIIARDPVRYRPLMIPGLLEKLSFGLAVPVLYAGGRVAGLVAALSVVDLVWGALFFVAFRRTAGMSYAGTSSPSTLK